MFFKQKSFHVTTVFFATDIHGSERCFIKFINAAKFYKAGVIIMGGDITGKLVIPVFEQHSGHWAASVFDREHVAKTVQELAELESMIRAAGFYPYRTTAEVALELAQDTKRQDQLFEDLASQTLARWLAIAEERLRGTDVQCFMTPGNDDVAVVDAMLTRSSAIVNPEDRVVKIDTQHEMVSSGFSNITPWHTPRELPEEQLEEKLECMMGQVEDFSTCIFNLHVPPKDSQLDNCQVLDENLRPVMRGGQVEMQGAGSSAVLHTIQRHQPLLALHGHIHESRGMVRIGRTLCINPGSSYGDGILQGALVSLEGQKVLSYQLTTG